MFSDSPLLDGFSANRETGDILTQICLLLYSLYIDSLALLYIN